MFFLKEEVYIGYSLDYLWKVRDALSKEGIKYTYKTVSHSGQWSHNGSRRGLFGSLGLNMDYERQYSVSVKYNDYDTAKRLVEKVLHL